MAVSVRALTPDDLPAMAEVHRAAFSEAALSLLGNEAVRRYYEWQMEGPHEAESLGAFQGDRLVGLCVGGLFRGAVSGFVRKNVLWLIFRILMTPQIFFTEEMRSRIGIGLRVFFPKAPPKDAPKIPPAAARGYAILSICTHPDVRGSGAGKALILAAEESAKKNGFERMRLTVHPSNSKAIGFYSSLGWQKLKGDGEWKGSMIKPLRPA